MLLYNTLIFYFLNIFSERSSKSVFILAVIVFGLGKLFFFAMNVKIYYDFFQTNAEVRECIFPKISRLQLERIVKWNLYGTHTKRMCTLIKVRKAG